MLQRQKKLYQENKTPEKHDDVVFVLIIYIYDHFLTALGEKSTVFLDFLKRTEKEELNEFKKIIFSLASDGKEHKETSLYSKAAMVEFSMTDEEAIAEFDRATDTLRLKNDSEFTEYLKNLAKKLQKKAINTSSIKKEQGSGQVEIATIASTDIDKVINDTELIKKYIVELAKEESLEANFKPKPFQDDCPSALQINLTIQGRLNNGPKLINLFINCFLLSVFLLVIKKNICLK